MVVFIQRSFLITTLPAFWIPHHPTFIPVSPSLHRPHGSCSIDGRPLLASGLPRAWFKLPATGAPPGTLALYILSLLTFEQQEVFYP